MAKKTEGNKPERTAAQKLQDKKDAFLRVCEPRLNKAVKSIHLVELCASPNYESSPEQVKAVVLVLQTAVDKVKASFAGEKKAVAGIKLPS